MNTNWIMWGASVVLAVSGVACTGDTDNTATGEDDLTAAQQDHAPLAFAHDNHVHVLQRAGRRGGPDIE